MKYKDQNKAEHDLIEDIISLNFEHEHPLVKEDHPDKIKAWCPICNVLFGIVVKDPLPSDRRE